MITYEFNCPVHERVEEDFEFGDDVPSSAPCPVIIYEGDPDEGTFDEHVHCNEDSPRILSLPAVVIIK